MKVSQVIAEDLSPDRGWLLRGWLLAVQSNLGLMYDNGEGVPEDDRQAVFWYRKAAKQGDAVAQSNLGNMYDDGEGVPKDDVQAYVWINLAAAQGDEEAKQDRTLIRQRMTPAQIAEAQKLSRELAAWIAEARSEPALALISDDPVRPPDPSRDTVRQVQAYLALLGYGPGPVDGLPGSRRTMASVRRFQQDLGMSPTGRISDELLVLLKAAAARQKKPAESVSCGSGFLVSRDGGVVTNHHVVDGCAKVTVNHAGTSHDVTTIRAVDAGDGLALLEAPPGTGEAATFSESPRASLGEAVTVAGLSPARAPVEGVQRDERQRQLPCRPRRRCEAAPDHRAGAAGQQRRPAARQRRERDRRGGEQVRRRPRREADRRHPAERQLRHQGRIGAQLPRRPRRRLPPPPVEREARPGTTRGNGARLHRRRALLGVDFDELGRHGESK